MNALRGYQIQISITSHSIVTASETTRTSVKFASFAHDTLHHISGNCCHRDPPPPLFAPANLHTAALVA